VYTLEASDLDPSYEVIRAKVAFDEVPAHIKQELMRRVIMGTSDSREKGSSLRKKRRK
jgi:hypothetical protein